MVYETLQKIQTELKAPKNLRNTFGGYNYRNAEGILEALKPILAKYNSTLVITDEINEIGGRIYVTATAIFRDAEGQATSASASAREPESKKGMDESQITGAASSYARKYALNGLFLLDDTKDPDTDEYQKEATAKAGRKKAEPKPKLETIGASGAALLKGYIDAAETRTGKTINQEKLLSQYGVQSFEDFSPAQAADLTRKLEGTA